MKILLFLSLFVSTSIFSQTSFNTEKQALTKFPQKDVYQCNSGWLLHKGDVIELGKGSMPDKSFAFVKSAQNGVALFLEDNETRERKLGFQYNNAKGLIKDFYVYGNKKIGYYIIARLKVGQLRQDLYIENAIEAGEIKVPEQYAKKNDEIGSPSQSKADEIKKLKELVDSGALTKDEFDAEKKKILAK